MNDGALIDELYIIAQKITALRATTRGEQYSQIDSHLLHAHVEIHDAIDIAEKINPTKTP